MQIATKASVYALATHEPTDPSCKHYIGLFTDQDGSARLAQHKSKGVNHKTREQYASRPFDLWTKVILRSYDCRTKRQWCIASAVTYYWELNYNILTHASVTEDGGLNCQILDSIAFFTAQDEDNMCQYLAMTVPQKENGGRLGRNLWKEMVRNFHFLPEPYYWTQNHSWQSWREHYKKNQTRLDPIILRYVLKAKPTAKSTFGYVRNHPFPSRQASRLRANG
ncbi:hypothetical protein C8J56DRAFT_352216 [Mycena floridula]|nr:hypothetical protein C8J56DRAFT_352216 [Mycena floridula]